MTPKDECGYCHDLCPVDWWCTCDCGLEPAKPPLCESGSCRGCDELRMIGVEDSEEGEW